MQFITDLYKKLFIAIWVILFLTLITLQSLESAINIPTSHMDGAFQTASGLFRIDSGQMPGRDFFPYLGIGPLLLIFPFFKVAGSSISASVFSAQFLTLTLVWIYTSVLWYLIMQPRIAALSLVAGSVVSTVFFLIEEKIFGFSLFFTPGNSLKPIRSAAPYLLGIAIYILINNYEKGQKRNILAGLLIGITMLWSNDYAITTSGVFAIFYFTYLHSQENSTWKTSSIVFFLAAIFSYIALLSFITIGHSFEFIKYNLINVAKDQWWYFGSYGPSTRIFSIFDARKILLKASYIPILVLIFSAIIALKTKKKHIALLALIGFTLFIGGAVASVGGHIETGYFFAFYYWAITTTIITFFKAFRYIPSNRLQKIKISYKLFTLSTLPLLIATGYKWHNYNFNLDLAKNDPKRFYIPELKGYLSIDWKDYILYARKNQKNKVTEEYWGIWSSFNRSFPSWPVDSVIHALGDVRNTAKQSLKDTDLIISTRHSASPNWQPWSLSQNFWFYDELISSWIPVFYSPKTIVWQKIKETRNYQNVGCDISVDRKSFTIQSNTEGFYKVKLSYTHIAFGRYILMMRNNISFGLDAGGYVSLPLGSSMTTIPVLITKKTGNTFQSKSIGNREIDFKIESCISQKIPYENNDVFYQSIDK